MENFIFCAVSHENLFNGSALNQNVILCNIGNIYLLQLTIGTLQKGAKYTKSSL